jgi:hypothetical protein
MSKPLSFILIAKPIRGIRLGRLLVVLLVAVVAGLVSDWLRTEQRLVFPRPLPEFKTRESNR